MEMFAHRSRTSLSVSTMGGEGSLVERIYTSPLFGLAATRGDVTPARLMTFTRKKRDPPWIRAAISRTTLYFDPAFRVDVDNSEYKGIQAPAAAHLPRPDRHVPRQRLLIASCVLWESGWPRNSSAACRRRACCARGWIGTAGTSSPSGTSAAWEGCCAAGVFVCGRTPAPQAHRCSSGPGVCATALVTTGKAKTNASIAQWTMETDRPLVFIES